MINREDMLALTRRMTVKRTSMTRIAGGYLDMDGYIDGTFNTGFLKLSPDEKEKNLQIAKVIPFADTNQNLKEYAFSSEKMKGDSMWKLLMGMRVCGLKNDALMETFYEIVGEQYQAMGDYAVYVFHDRYDIPAKGKDHVRQGESEEMFEYLICAICPVSGDYEPGEPECGFLFPAFMDGAAALNYVDVYQKDQAHLHTELLKMLGVGFSPHPPVSVYGTGTYKAIAAFLGTGLTCFATFISLRVTLSAHAADLPAAHLLRLHRYFHSRPMLSPCVPTVLFICGTGI